MDARHFDRLARALSEAGTRRGLLGLLATLPVLGGLFALLDPDETEAKGRRKRRKKKHKHGKGRHKGKHKKKCKPHAKTKTCASKCGQVKNNCKKTVDCGSCACDPACEECHVCNEITRVCEVDPAQQGEPCGESGQVCQANGDCECDASSCGNPTPLCVAGSCTACGNGADCQNAGLGDLCCGGSCFSGDCCDSSTCGGTTPICVSNVCTACTSSAQCPAGQLCDGGACQSCDVVNGEVLATAVGTATDGDTLYVCAGAYTGGFSIAQNITLVGAGQGTDGTVIQGGDNVLTIFAGTASQPVTLRNLRIQNGARGIQIRGGRHLTMTDCTVRGNSSSSPGVGILNGGGTLNMIRCTVENNTSDIGGGLYNSGGWATLTDCLFQGNTAGSDGGGIFNLNAGAVTLGGTRVTNNTASGGSGIFNFGNSGATVTLLAGSSVCANTPTLGQCVNVTGACTDTCPA